MTEQWGAPLTGAQMKLLRAAGLPDGEWIKTAHDDDREDFTQLRPTSIAYTLLEAGWLDGRNVALWFGGNKAPDDWLGGSDVLLSSGRTCGASLVHNWKDFGGIIAYIRKAEGSTTHADRVLAETVTIAKMTEAEAAEWLRENGWFGGGGNLNLLKILGIVKPEPTRLERFWATRDIRDVPAKAFQLIEEAVEFE